MANDLGDVPKSVGIRYHPQSCATMRSTPSAPQPDADRPTSSPRASSHVSVTTLSQNPTGRRHPAQERLVRARVQHPAGNPGRLPAACSMVKTYVDANNNFAFDAGEKQRRSSRSRRWRKRASATAARGRQRSQRPSAELRPADGRLGGCGERPRTFCNWANEALARDTIEVADE